MKRFYIYITAFLLAACGSNMPDGYSSSDSYPSISPDYTDITIPGNIAPMNFRIENRGERYLTLFTAGNTKTAVRGDVVAPNRKQWEDLKREGNIDVQVFVKENGSWTGYKPFTMTVADDIDPYISYRLIPPSVESYERLSINQRDLTSFKEKVIYANSMVQQGESGQCINCHHYRNWETDNMQFHARQFLGGTIILFDGDLRKVNLKTDSTISAGVYPAWHPTHDYIAYSTNKTHQSIHTADYNRIEVTDEESDLILYDIRANAVSIIENDPDKFECFPAWTPDGLTLYYVSADYIAPFDKNRMNRVFLDSHTIKYDLYRKPFNPDSRTWGPSELVIDASAIGKSITLPRISPDGRHLMFSMGDYGIFHIWHRDADLYMMDLNDGSVRSLDEVNSPDVESYHSWSSNGRWVIFSTRREDGAYTRLYLTHMDTEGNFSKPFAIPQRNPDFNRNFMFSFNIPEFMKEPVTVSAGTFAKFIKDNDAQPVSFQTKKEE
ncbi:MAG: TolB family protein [Bacteroidaceae bacterium]|jgi:hypothetical protein|nr:hypothetical protein [Bacteroidales bacterium]